MKFTEITAPLLKIVGKELGSDDAELFMTRFSQLMTPVLMSAQLEVALALKAYLLWGDVPVFTNHLLSVAFDDLRSLADDLVTRNQHNPSINPSNTPTE